MSHSFQLISRALLAGFATLAFTVPDLHAQRGGMSMSRGMMMRPMAMPRGMMMPHGMMMPQGMMTARGMMISPAPTMSRSMMTPQGVMTPQGTVLSRGTTTSPALTMSPGMMTPQGTVLSRRMMTSPAMTMPQAMTTRQVSSNAALTGQLPTTFPGGALGLNPNTGAVTSGAFGARSTSPLSPLASAANATRTSGLGAPLNGSMAGAGQSFSPTGSGYGPSSNPYSPPPGNPYLSSSTDTPRSNQEKTATVAEDRQPSQPEQQKSSPGNPPASDVWSGKALNELLADLSKVVARSEPSAQPGFRMSMVAEGLGHIRTTPAAENRGSLQKAEGFGWPAELSSPGFQELRERLNAHVQEAVKQAATSARVEPPLLQQMRLDVDQLRRQLNREVGELTPSEYLQSRRFLDGFDDAVKALHQGNGSGRFPGQYVPRTETAIALVRQMTAQGLQFAPAAPGDEAAYSALHQTLATCQQAARGQAPAR
jgi:hypothetical protein